MDSPLFCPRCNKDRPRQEFRDVHTVYRAGVTERLVEHKRCKAWVVLPRDTIAA